MDIQLPPGTKTPFPANRQSVDTLIQPSFFELDSSETETENLD